METETDLKVISQQVLDIDYFPDTSFLSLDIKQFSKIPLSEITAIGNAAVTVISSLAHSANGLYRVTFPKGVGELVKVKGGSGYRAMLHGADGKITGQAVLHKVKSVDTAAIGLAVVMAFISHEITEIKRMNTDIMEALERDKKAQLLADLELLTEYSENYRLYEENEATILVNLNQVKNIKRNAQKELHFYREEIEDVLSGKWTTSLLKGASEKVARLYNKFARFKLANYVYAFSALMETMLSKNYQEQYLAQTIEKLRNYLISFQQLYTNCYYEIEKYMQQDIGTLAMNGLAKAQRFAGKTVSKMPIKNKAAGDKLKVAGDKLLCYSEVTEEKEKERIQNTKNAFIRLKDSGLSVFIKDLDQINTLHNKPCALIWDKEMMYICTETETV